MSITCTVESRYLEVDGTIFYKFQLLEVHFRFRYTLRASQNSNFIRLRDIRVRDIELRRIRDIRVRISRFDCMSIMGINKLHPQSVEIGKPQFRSKTPSDMIRKHRMPFGKHRMPSVTGRNSNDLKRGAHDDR